MFYKMYFSVCVSVSVTDIQNGCHHQDKFWIWDNMWKWINKIFSEETKLIEPELYLDSPSHIFIYFCWLNC